MSDQNKHTDDLIAIRKMMEDSSRFLSLSGLSGVFTGIFAIIGAFIAWFLILDKAEPGVFDLVPDYADPGTKYLLLLDGIIVLIAAVGTAYFLALRKSRKKEQKFWSPVTRRLLINMVIPLIAGGIFILIFIINNTLIYIVPAMLIFYGLALLNAGKFTFGEVQYLGVLEIITGFFAGLFPGNGLIFWITGFGFLHIMYGIILHRKYN